MNNNIMLSIVIPVYNVESYLEECLKSIIKNYNKNIEVILIDDGSTDNSGDICNLYENKYDFIRVKHRVNGGLSAARNTGLDLAIGKYVWFIDSDDYISDSSISDILKRVDEDVDVIVGNQAVFCGEEIKSIYQDFIELKKDETLFNYFKRLGNISYVASRFVVKREIIIKNNLRFYEGIYHEDEEWSPRVICSAKSFSLIKDPIYYYRVGNPNSIMGKKNSKKIIDKIHISNLIYDSIKNKNVDIEKKEYLNTRIAHNYITALNEANTYDKEERKQLFCELRKNKYLLDDINDRKSILVRNIIRIVGISNASKLLNFRTTIKKEK